MRVDTARLAKQARIAFPGGELTVIERLPGTATTDFGAPDRPAAAEARRMNSLVASAWTVFDRVVWRTAATRESTALAGRARCRRGHRLDARWRQVGDPAGDVGVLAEVVAGADAVVAVRDGEEPVMIEAPTHQQDR
jgi:hypothetical protein